MQLYYGVPKGIEQWMSPVTQVRWNFPGLDIQEKLNEHRATVLRFMEKRQTICKIRLFGCSLHRKTCSAAERVFGASVGASRMLFMCFPPVCSPFSSSF